jgi:hypothetical protein
MEKKGAAKQQGQCLPWQKIKADTLSCCGITESLEL